MTPGFSKREQVGPARKPRRLAPGRTLPVPDSPMRAMSEKRQVKVAGAKGMRDAVREGRCVVKEIGGFAVPPCFGPSTVHEPWTRARGGPIDDPRNTVACCAGHNTWLSQSVEGLRFGEANGLLIHAQDGPGWLEAGGVLK